MKRSLDLYEIAEAISSQYTQPCIYRRSIVRVLLYTPNAIRSFFYSFCLVVSRLASPFHRLMLQRLPLCSHLPHNQHFHTSSTAMTLWLETLGLRSLGTRPGELLIRPYVLSWNSRYTLRHLSVPASHRYIRSCSRHMARFPAPVRCHGCSAPPRYPLVPTSFFSHPSTVRPLRVVLCVFATQTKTFAMPALYIRTWFYAWYTCMPSSTPVFFPSSLRLLYSNVYTLLYIGWFSISLLCEYEGGKSLALWF